MDEPGSRDAAREVPPGRLSRPAAQSLLTRGDELLASGDFGDAAIHYQRVVGFDDPAITAAALLGLGEARYRLDDEAGAVATWEAAIQVGETPSTYPAWRNVAAARVRAGDMRGAQRAYREADRRAPAGDKAEIASRLGWLAKEAGDAGSAGRYFAKARGDGPLIPVSTIVIAATSIISLVVLFTAEGPDLLQALWLDKLAVAGGEYWRLWTVTLVHADPLHLFFNMYALYLAGSITERWYGSLWFLILYLVCAAAGSVASFVFGGDVPAVGASGAVFGLFGVLLAANRLHHPVDRANRGLVGQLGFLVLLNLVFGFASGGQIDNAAHLGGLFAGLWLGAAIRPTGVPTMSAMWRRPGGATAALGSGAAPTSAPAAEPPRLLPAFAVGAVVVVVVAGIFIGTAAREGGFAAGPPAVVSAHVVVSVPAVVTAARWAQEPVPAPRTD
jgi:membrane associated rhomboid family serine protease